MPMISGNCDTCQWYEPNDKKGDSGTCHKQAPLPAVFEKIPGEKKKFLTVWPQVDFDGWCGDHVPMEEKKKPK